KSTSTKQANKNLNYMYDLNIYTVKQFIFVLENTDKNVELEVFQNEDKIDKMEKEFRKKHIIRMNAGQCTGSAGIVFVDIISNLERIGDHAVNIAETIIE